MAPTDSVAPSADALSRAAAASSIHQVRSPEIDIPEHLRVKLKGDPAELRRKPIRSEFREERAAAKEQLASDRNSLQRELEELNKLAEELDYQLKYGLFEGTEELYVQILDRRSNELIKTIPPEEFLKLRARLNEFVGVILDEEA